MSQTLPGDVWYGLCRADRFDLNANPTVAAPIYPSRLHPGWMLTRYADVSAVLRSPDALALDPLPFFRLLCERSGLELPTLIGFYGSFAWLTRPPQHDGLRRLLSEALNGVRRLDLPTILDRRADALLDEGAHANGIDLAAGFGRKLALFVIGRFFGIPEDDIPELSALAAEFSTVVFEWFLPSLSVLRRLETCGTTLSAYFSKLLDQRRVNPGEDGISRLLSLADKYLGFTPEDLVRYCVTFFVIGEETTAAAISGAAMMLLQRPALRAQLAAEPSLVPAAARECLRLMTPLQYVSRQLPTDTILHGQMIRAGEPLLLMLGTANRDPAAFPNPDEVVLGRTGPQPLAFGAGAYRCVGEQLALFEIELGMRKILQRRGLQLTGEPPVWSSRTNVGPLLHLQARFDA